MSEVSVIFWRFKCIEQLSAFTPFLIPVYLSPTIPARPFLFLSLQPLFNAVFPDVLKVGFHGRMMLPFVVHKVMKFTAGVVGAEAAEIDFAFFATNPEFTLLNPVTNIVTQTTIAVRRRTSAAEKSAGTIL